MPMLKATVDVIGDKELIEKVRHMSRRTRGQVLATAVLDGAYIVERAAKRKAPVLTGNLRASLRSEVTKIQNSFAQADTGTNVEYADFVERGTENQQAQPYLRPAFDENVDRIQRAIASSVRRQILAVAQ